MTDCRISEYDGAFRCWTHNRMWGAVPEPDEPCKGAWTPKPHDKCFSDCGCESSAYEQRIAALEAELAAVREDHRIQIANIVREVQRYQPEGSPPPGDEMTLIRWILGRLDAGLAAALKEE
jgi:hypothetical protein